MFINSCSDVNQFSAGSYPYSENYLINQPKDSVIKKIEELKEEFPNYKVPSFIWAGEEITLNDKFLENGYYTFYIFIEEKNQIVHSYIREINSNATIIGIVSVQNGLTLGNWMVINKDLSEEENKEIKYYFEKNVVSKIKW
jgi:hypothetical protein